MVMGGADLCTSCFQMRRLFGTPLSLWLKAIPGVSAQINREAVSGFVNGNFKICLLLKICFLHLYLYLTCMQHLERAFYQ